MPDGTKSPRPVGPIPEFIWLEHRAIELCHAIERCIVNDQRSVELHDSIHDWIQELDNINSKLTSRIFYLKEQEKRKEEESKYEPTANLPNSQLDDGS